MRTFPLFYQIQINVGFFDYIPLSGAGGIGSPIGLLLILTNAS